MSYYKNIFKMRSYALNINLASMHTLATEKSVCSWWWRKKIFSLATFLTVAGSIKTDVLRDSNYLCHVNFIHK